jgi:hypothetical protein
MERFLSNYLLLKNKGFVIHAVCPAYPPLLKEIDKYRKLFLEKNIAIKFDYFYGRYNNKTYPASYTKQELEIFGLNSCRKEKKDNFTICNAGYNALFACTHGQMWLCPMVPFVSRNIYKEIKFNDTLIKCRIKNCECPFNSIDRPLYNKALQETKKYITININKCIIITCLHNFVVTSNRLRIRCIRTCDRLIGLTGIAIKKRSLKTYLFLKKALFRP